MGFYSPSACAVGVCLGYSTQNWLLVGIAGLAVVVIALLVELVVQMRRAPLRRACRWTWLPITPMLVWSLVCGVLAGKAITWYFDEATILTAPLGSSGGPVASSFGSCLDIAQTGAAM